MDRPGPPFGGGGGQYGRHPAHEAGFDLDMGIYQSGVIAT